MSPSAVTKPVSLRGNRVYAYLLDLDRRVLALHTEFVGPPRELTDVRFEGVLTHHFERVTAPTVLLDVAEVPHSEVIGEWPALFEAGRDHGWPLPSTGPAELIRALKDARIKAFRVMGELGLEGFVLAEALNEVARNEPAAHV